MFFTVRAPPDVDLAVCRDHGRFAHYRYLRLTAKQGQGQAVSRSNIHVDQGKYESHQVVNVVWIVFSREAPGIHEKLSVAVNGQRENEVVADWSNERVDGSCFRFGKRSLSLEAQRAWLVAGTGWSRQAFDLSFVFQEYFTSANVLTSSETQIEVSVAVSSDTVRPFVRLPRLSPHPVVSPRVLVPVHVDHRMYVPREEISQLDRDVIFVGDELEHERTGLCK